MDDNNATNLMTLEQLEDTCAQIRAGELSPDQINEALHQMRVGYSTMHRTYQESVSAITELQAERTRLLNVNAELYARWPEAESTNIDPVTNQPQQEEVKTTMADALIIDPFEVRPNHGAFNGVNVPTSTSGEDET